jgi:hypothetical protein
MIFRPYIYIHIYLVVLYFKEISEFNDSEFNDRD